MNYIDVPVYKNSLEYAKSHGDFESYRESRLANNACVDAINKSINENYTAENYHLDTDKVIDSVTSQFGKDRMEYIFAVHVVNQSWDGRYSSDVKAWAGEKTGHLSANELDKFYLSAHPILINGLIQTIEKREKELKQNKEETKKPEEKKYPSQKEKVDEITEKLENGIQELFSGEKYTEYLKTMSKFHNYSFNNTVLIAMQKPDATLVAGFNSWKNLERNVNKGEKGIKIFAYAPYKKKEEVIKRDPDTDMPLLDKDGNPIKEEKIIEVPSFKVVSVFDVSQTNGKELPTLGVSELEGDVKDYEKFFSFLKEISPVPIKFEKIEEEGCHGYYHQVDKEITIDEGMSQIQTVKTAIHEIAHAMLHDKDDVSEKKDSNTKEVEAESIAYTVCQHFGIDTSDYSFGYVAGWSSGKELPELKSSLEIIKSKASDIICKIEAKYRGLVQEDVKEEKTDNKKDIIGNVKYSDIKDKKYIKLESSLAEQIAAKLAEENIPFSGRIKEDFTTITIDKSDINSYKAIEKEINSVNILIDKTELNKYQAIVDTCVKHHVNECDHIVEYYIIRDRYEYLSSGKGYETYNNFEEALARFKELKKEDCTKKVLYYYNGSPIPRLTLGVDTKLACGNDIIWSMGEKNYLNYKNPSMTIIKVALKLISEIPVDMVSEKRMKNRIDMPLEEWFNTSLTKYLSIRTPSIYHKFFLNSMKAKTDFIKEEQKTNVYSRRAAYSKNATYRKITEEEKEKIKRIDLVDYLENRGVPIQRTGSTYKLRLSKEYPGDLSSLSIFSDRKGWKRWSNGTGGADAISFLEKVEGLSYQEACEELLHTHRRSLSPSMGAPIPIQDSEKKELQLPEKCEGKFSRVYAYLTNTRCIDPEIVKRLMKENYIYQDVKGNVVFLGFDENKETKFACIRGTTEKQFRMDCTGSDKHYCFKMPGSNKSKLFVFESPIDAMSHATLTNMVYNNPKAWLVYNRLALSGTSDGALEHYLKQNTEITEINLCLDNDEAGRTASAALKEKYESLGYTVKECPSMAKDFNEDLVLKKTEELDAVSLMTR